MALAPSEWDQIVQRVEELEQLTLPDLVARVEITTTIDDEDVTLSGLTAVRHHITGGQGKLDIQHTGSDWRIQASDHKRSVIVEGDTALDEYLSHHGLVAS